mgnify:CR=1 FL=1
MKCENEILLLYSTWFKHSAHICSLFRQSDFTVCPIWNCQVKIIHVHYTQTTQYDTKVLFPPWSKVLFDIQIIKDVIHTRTKKVTFNFFFFFFFFFLIKISWEYCKCVHLIVLDKVVMIAAPRWFQSDLQLLIRKLLVK